MGHPQATPSPSHTPSPKGSPMATPSPPPFSPLATATSPSTPTSTSPSSPRTLAEMLDTPPGGKRKRESRHYEGISLDCILATSKCAEQRRTITPRRFKFAVKQSNDTRPATADVEMDSDSDDDDDDDDDDDVIVTI